MTIPIMKSPLNRVQIHAELQRHNLELIQSNWSIANANSSGQNAGESISVGRSFEFVEKATVSPMRIFQRDVDKLALSLD
jgi:PPE-repeat protein